MPDKSKFLILGGGWECYNHGMKKFVNLNRHRRVLASVCVFVLAAALIVSTRATSADVGGCGVLPSDNIWNTRIDSLDPHPNSDNFIARIGSNAGLHPDFGTVYDGAPNGIPYIVVPTNQPLVAVTLTPYGNEADPGPYPIPTNAPIEGGPNSTGDRHILILREGDCKLFELYRAFPNANGSWRAYGASFDLKSNALRPAGWTSADAAGLAMLPGLVKYDEVQAALSSDGVIHHALRFTVPQAYQDYVWPARHLTETSTNPNDPPMGLRFRLKSDFNISGFSPSNQVILRTLKLYGMFVADNGSGFYLSGTPNMSWDDDDLHDLQTGVHGYNFEAVDESALIVNADSGQARQAGANTSTPTATSLTQQTATSTRTRTPSSTATSTTGASATPTRTKTRSRTPTRTSTRTSTPTRTRTATQTATRTATRTPKATWTPKPTLTRTPTPTHNTSQSPTLGGCALFPANSIFNTPVDTLPLDPRSDAYIASIGRDTGMHPDFGAGLYDGAPVGIPYNLARKKQPLSTVRFTYREESDKGPYPIPSLPKVEGGSDSHLLTVQKKKCFLYELFAAHKNNRGKWRAGSGAIWDLKSNLLRPVNWTSADAAGLPITPLLVRQGEVVAGEIKHALRFTANRTRSEFIWPARHEASDLASTNVPPMGQRFRLKASFDVSDFSPQTQVILNALKRYGMFLADNGSDWYLSGAPNENWDNETLLREFRRVKGSDFEAVDESGLMVDPNSGQAQLP